MRTHVDEAAGVVERAEVRAGQTEEGVEFVNERRHLGSSQCCANYEIPERVAHETATNTHMRYNADTHDSNT